MDFSEEAEGEATVVNTVSASKPARGRPKGSKNKAGREAREILAVDGLAGIKVLCAIAAGRAVYRPLKGGGKERLVPELADMITAQKAILSRLVPELKAVESTVDQTVRNAEPQRDDIRQWARGVCAADPELAHALAEGQRAKERAAQGAYTATFTDPDLQRVFPADTDEADGDLAAELVAGNGEAAGGDESNPNGLAEASSPAPSPLPSDAAEGWQHFPFGPGGPYVQKARTRWLAIDRHGVIQSDHEKPEDALAAVSTLHKAQQFGMGGYMHAAPGRPEEQSGFRPKQPKIITRKPR
jgi:hypothetical protein